MAQRHSDDIAREAHRSVEIADEQDRVAQTGRHASTSTSRFNRPAPTVVAAPSNGLNACHSAPSELTLATLPRPQPDVEELALLQCCSGQPESDHRLGPLTKLSRTTRHRRDRARAACGRTSGADSSGHRLRHRGAARRPAATTLRSLVQGSGEPRALWMRPASAQAALDRPASVARTRGCGRRFGSSQRQRAGGGACAATWPTSTRSAGSFSSPRSTTAVCRAKRPASLWASSTRYLESAAVPALAARFQPPPGDLFLALAAGEGQALGDLVGFAGALGFGEEALRAHEPIRAPRPSRRLSPGWRSMGRVPTSLALLAPTWLPGCQLRTHEAGVA